MNTENRLHIFKDSASLRDMQFCVLIASRAPTKCKCAKKPSIASRDLLRTVVANMGGMMTFSKRIGMSCNVVLCLIGLLAASGADAEDEPDLKAMPHSSFVDETKLEELANIVVTDTKVPQLRNSVTQNVAVLLVGLAATSHLFAAEVPEDLSSPFVRDSKLILQLRSHYLERDKSAATGSLSWAGGGWLQYRSGWAFDVFRLGLTGYTAQKLYGPADKDGASVLATGQQPYTVFGEAFAALKYGEQELATGRFLVNQHEVNPQDTRMSPRTFQGTALSGKVGIVEYFGGYISKMKTRNSADFIDVATVAGAPASISEPLLLLSVHVAPDENLNFGFSSYRIKDVLASTYADATGTSAIAADSKLALGGQYMHQSSTGANLLTGSAFSTNSAGIRLDWMRGPLTLSGTLMQTGRSAAYRTPFGSWQGYACRIITSFNRAGEQVHAIDAALNLEHMGAPGLGINGSATFGSGAIDAATGAALPDNAEYDLTLDYRWSAATWPEWARPLWLRARIARLEQRLGSVSMTTDEYHLILNYTVTLK